MASIRGRLEGLYIGAGGLMVDMDLQGLMERTETQLVRMLQGSN